MRGTPLEMVPIGEPVPDIVEFLEGVLVEAKNGNIRAVSCAWVIADGTDSPMTQCGFKAEIGRGRYLESATAALKRSIGRWLDEE
jgi:hypothetical protein